eukprot:CAMPEP_0178402120 /NCGR_PEP_ID=MMETSP0689_2-20121128/16671_1 /TAXON_ID=160604 /ORGANISM="Amphidinium massartii, Strain CS-259" /LENGTH=302 /DNA_ID=CAMNT_0020022997 /DNA_START=163 /DNA_END=1071 /DNA_ORIENTATION=+
MVATAAWTVSTSALGLQQAFLGSSLNRSRRPDTSRRAESTEMTTAAGKKLLVIGGTGYVGKEVVKNAVQRGFEVTAMSRRGENPDPGDSDLSSVRWVKGDATNYDTVNSLVGDADAVVHACGLLFDANSGLANLNIIVSGSGSLPADDSTYDRITRLTAFNVIEAVSKKLKMPFSAPTPVAFVSCAEAGWTDVTLGPQVEQIVPEFLREYLVAKRAVEARLATEGSIRPVVVRPSLIWDWTKLDVLPIIPVWNLLASLGVPFLDKTVNVATISKAIVAGIEDDAVSGVQRYPEMEELADRLD